MAIFVRTVGKKLTFKPEVFLAKKGDGRTLVDLKQGEKLFSRGR